MVALLIAPVKTLHAAAAQTPAEQLYAELAKLKPDQRTKRLEEGARKEGKLTFVHTWRGKLARDFLAKENWCPRYELNVRPAV